MTPTFRDFALQGSTIQAVRFERADLDRAIQVVNERFETDLSAPEALFAEIVSGLRLAAGRFSHETEAIERPELLKRLTALKDAAGTIATALQLAAGPGVGDDYDTATFVLIRDVMASLGHEEAGGTLDQIHRAAIALVACCDEAEAIVAQMRDKKGRRVLDWYDAFAEVVLHAAERLGLAAHTAGDRGHNPHATPFTVLAHELEKALPQAAGSKSLAACKKRLQRSLARLRAETK